MTKLKCAVLAVLVLASASVKADGVGIFFGVGYAFGSSGGPGVSFKLLSDREEHKAVVGAGVSYYPMSTNKFGADISAGYNFNNSAITVGYDFLQSGVVLGAGYVNTKDDNGAAAPVVTPTPPQNNNT
ncbi:hypothetical protein [Methylotenera sp.]|uniref:hypothetical protein n=1 Tax=Methylotenera sp. TaxID=2051956 RepID=UPI00248A842E|nr:hypothetical protein [Methylotenera sp.]MDI1298953.1 hypothetical protein [Methylotenera sp.]